MHDAARLAGLLLAHQAQGVVRGAAGVDDQRLAGRARGADVGAKARALPFGRVLLPVVVEPGFADRHHLGMVGERDQARHIGFFDAVVVGMDADRRPQVGVALGEAAHAREVFQLHADAQRGADVVGRHGGEDLVLAAGKVGKIEVTV